MKPNETPEIRGTDRRVVSSSESDQDPFIPVPIPASYVTKVMAYVGVLAGHVPSSTAASTGGDDAVAEALAAEQAEEDADKDWTLEELARVAKGRTFTTEVLTQILDVLVEDPGTWMTSAELAAQIGREPESIRRIWTHVSRHINKRYPGLPWPLRARWGPNFDHPRDAVVYYCMTDEEATLWREVRGNPEA